MPASLRLSKVRRCRAGALRLPNGGMRNSSFVRCRSHARNGTARACAIALARSDQHYAFGIQRAWTFLPVLKAMIMESRQMMMKQKIMIRAPVKLPVAS